MSNNDLDFASQSTAFWAILVLISLLVVILFALTFRKHGIVAVTKRLERSIGLAVPDNLRALVGRRLLQRRRFALAGTVLAAWAAVPFFGTVGGLQGTGMSTRMLLLVAATFAGNAVGTAVGSLRSPARSDDESIRYARPRAVEIGDYVAPFERRGAWAIVGLAAATLFTSLIFNVSGLVSVPLLPPATIGGLMVLFAATALGLFELVGRSIVGRAQPTGSEMEPVWDDQMRAADVRGLAIAPVMLGFYGALTCGIDLTIALKQFIDQTVALIAVNVGGYFGMIVVILIGIFSLVSHPERFFLRRLWPQYTDLSARLIVGPVADTTGPES